MLKNLLAIAALLSTVAFAAPNADPGKPGFPIPAAQRYVLNNGFGFPAQLGTQVTDHSIHVAKGGWSVLKTGGASVVLPSAVLANLTDVDGKDLQLPYHSIIKQITVDVITAPVASASAGFTLPQLGLGLNTPGDLLAYASPGSFTGLVAGSPIGTAATMKKVGTATGSNKSGSVVKLNMKGGSVIQGQLNVFIEYYLSD